MMAWESAFYNVQMAEHRTISVIKYEHTHITPNKSIKILIMALSHL